MTGSIAACLGGHARFASTLATALAGTLLLGAAGCADNYSTPAGSAKDASVGAGTADMHVAPPVADAGDGWTGESALVLRIDDEPPPPLPLDMSRAEVGELLGAVADDVVLLELDSGPLLRNTLDQVKAACGDGWRLDDPDPHADCDLTPLGRSFVGRGGAGDWRSSPEYALVRLLTMTPSNARVEGTSIEFLQAVSDLAGIGGGFAQILSDTLEIGRTEEFLTTEAVVASMQENVLATHPALGGRDFIPVTLRDALTDMRTLGERLGPRDGHPGVVARGFQTIGPVFGPDFRMQVIADSNIRVLEGIDLSATPAAGGTGGKDYVSVIADVTGPSFDDPLEFDFSDPARFSVSGLVDNPTIDLRFTIPETDRFIDACTNDHGVGNCELNGPGTPEGGQSVWLLQPWNLEYIIAWAGLAKYGELVSEHCYVSCHIAEVAIGQNGTPPGWAHFGVALDLGPKDQYVWELINEVAQVGLHDSDFADFEEGQADVEFTVTHIEVGITGAEAAEAVRPWLGRQGSVIADFLLGDFRVDNGDVDFYWRRDAEGTPTLYFVGRQDRANGKPYAWQAPGFFADEAFTQRLSTPEGEGDARRERWSPPLGESVVFVKDDRSQVFRLRLTLGNPAVPDLDVRVSTRLAGQVDP